MSQVSELRDLLLQCLDQSGGIVEGTDNLTLAVTTLNSKSFVLRQLRKLESEGHVFILRCCGGRGRHTVYKLNRNSPGAPRRRRAG